jgi:hypothetical protein
VALTTTYSPPKRIQSGLIQSSNEHVSNIKELCVSIQILNGRDLMVVGFITTYAISAYHH